MGTTERRARNLARSHFALSMLASTLLAAAAVAARHRRGDISLAHVQWAALYGSQTGYG